MIVVEGTVRRQVNGKDVAIQFIVDSETGSFHQWGETTGVLGENVDLLEGIVAAVRSDLDD
jgi:TolB-like protein